jgi:hypothetical protein
LPGALKKKANSSTAVKTEEIKVEKVPSKRNRSKMSNKKFCPSLVDVKRLCFSCGKGSANVIKSGSSWMCYDCWKARLKYKNVSNFLGMRKEIVPLGTAEYLRPNCANCLQSYPLRSTWSNYQCFHKSVSLKGRDDDFEVGQQFILPSAEKPFEPSYLQNELIVWNQTPWFDDFNKSEDKQEGEVVIDTTEVSYINDGSSLSNVIILCDKTGELIDLRCENETPGSDETSKSHTEGEIGQRNSW